MKFHVIPANSLTSEHIQAWSRFQEADPAVHTPFLRPEFTQAVSSVRDRVEVAVMEDDGELAGFFPYQRSLSGTARPVGGTLCDFQGAIVDQDVEWDAVELIRGCGLNAWHFDHVIASQTPLQRYHWHSADSPFLDLSDGYDSYRAASRPARSKEIRQTGRKQRKLERDMGSLRFETISSDKEALTTLIRWKKEQYHRIKSVDHLAPAWTIPLIERIVSHDDEHFSGMMSVMYVRDVIAAVHVGIRSNNILHSWFPAYDRSLQKYSPGLILLLHIIQSAESLDIKRIDLGKGQEGYKRRFMSAANTVAEGSVDLRPVRRTIRRGWYQTRELVRSSSLREPAQAAIRTARSLLRSAKKELYFPRDSV